MELLVTIRKPGLMEKIIQMVDGIIAGAYFTMGFHYDLKEMKRMSRYCRTMGKKFYVLMDNFIAEDDKSILYEYMDILFDLNVDGIIFHDLGVYDVARSFNMSTKLIYDGKNVMCNSLDCAFLLKQGINSIVLSRELTFEEIKDIAHNNPERVDIQIFGHTRLSYSKRKFLSNYFREIDKEYDFLGKESLYLIEEKRDYKMPIVEDENGTYIFSDYIFEMFAELGELKPYLSKGIIDTLFIDDENLIMQAIREFRRVTADNGNFIKENFIRNYPGTYSSAFLYRKTNKTKDEED